MQSKSLRSLLFTLTSKAIRTLGLLVAQGFSTQNIDNLAKQRLLAKSLFGLDDGGVRVPFIVTYPKPIKANTKSFALYNLKEDIGEKKESLCKKIQKNPRN